MKTSHPTHTCSQCGRVQPASEFYRHEGRVNPWCKSCYRGWYIEKSGGLDERLCEHCASRFTVTKRDQRRRYCSRVCKEAAYNLRRSVERTSGTPSRSCVRCGNELAANKRTDARFCSEACRAGAARERNPDWKLKYRAKQYGLSLQDFQALLAKHNGRCAICKTDINKDGRALHIDHCHDTGKVRGILCANCNAMIGQAQNSPRILRRAASYLKQNS